jgi:alkylresorcinol/alkylpyrone synthase
MVRIASVAALLPENEHQQGELADLLAPLLTSDERLWPTIRRVHGAEGIDTRHLALAIDDYAELTTFQSTNDAFLVAGTELAAQAATRALAEAGLSAQDVDYLFFTSVTGIGAPSVDVRLAARLGLRPDVKHVPAFGLGCVGGAAGIARVRDYLAGHPHDVALLVSVELCSLTLQRGDASMQNIVSSGLFGDGVSVAVMVGADREESGVEVVASRSAIYPDSLDQLGWDIGGSGFRIILSPSLADIVEEHLARDVGALLDPHGLAIADVDTWIAHTGGPRILESAARALEVPDEAFAASWASLAKAGNLSSSSVLHVLADELAAEPKAPGSIGVLFAFGPGVCGEVVLLRWPEAPVEVEATP